jgi:virulence factor
MMRIAVIGLGHIAQKAYLPVIAVQPGVELVFCTRNRTRLDQLSGMYRVAEAVTDVNDVLQKGVDAAFVHTTTEAHVEIAGALLQSGIHVFVDKPIAYSYEQSRKLVEVAEQTGRMLMVGFNRRFAPMYASMHTVTDRRLVIMQKNRTFLPDGARRFVFDDFIHVVDTLRYLAPAEIQDTRVSFFQQEGQVQHVMLHLNGAGFSLIGLMNRNNGVTEETLEVMSPGNKWVVRSLNAMVHYAGGEERRQRFNDWDSVLHRRGFPQMVKHFLQCVKENRAPSPSAWDALETHAVCERIVAEAEQNGASA